MTVLTATFTRPRARAGSAPFVPTGSFRGDPATFDYVEEEWFASGETGGHPYTTSVFVRRPRDRARFSGVVVVEPVHAASAAPVWIYTSTYLMRSGHGWAAVCSQKSALEAFVKPFDPDRYASLEIWSDTPLPETTGVAAATVPRDRAAVQARMEQMQRTNVLSAPILAQVGAALGDSMGPFEGYDVGRVLLAGHSQTGRAVTEYILDAHDTQRRADGSPVYDGFFPSGAPFVKFGPCDVPIVQVLSEGDISDPKRWGDGRVYRRPDSDEPGDRYRLYELAGVAHMGTRYPPYSDNTMWQSDPLGTAGNVPEGAPMNSLPHGELFSAALHHLVHWVADGVVPPRADRIEVGPDDLFVKDEFGNSRGGVRCPQMDVPRLRYLPNPGVNEDGTPAFGVVGIEEPLPRETLSRLYHDHDDYVERFNRRLDELIDQGWLLAEDAEDLRNEAEKAEVP